MLSYYEMKKIKEFSKRNRILIIVFLVIFLTGCTKKPEINMVDPNSKGYFMGIMYVHYKCFIPMEFILTTQEDMRVPWSYETFLGFFGLPLFFADNDEEQMKVFDDYEFYFVIVKGELVEQAPKRIGPYNYFYFGYAIKVDEVVCAKVVDKEFVNCLFDKKFTWKEYENYYLKHPKEILKLCPCKPLKEIERRINWVTL